MSWVRPVGLVAHPAITAINTRATSLRTFITVSGASIHGLQEATAPTGSCPDTRRTCVYLPMILVRARGRVRMRYRPVNVGDHIVFSPPQVTDPGLESGPEFLIATVVPTA